MEKYHATIGFDKSLYKIKRLKKFVDDTNELTNSDLKKAKLLVYTSDFKKLNKCNYIIVAVPTPINKKGARSKAFEKCVRINR